MLLSLHIRDFVIVQDTHVNLASGFTAFTGQTGAGKSILIDALSLCLGARTDSTLVREGAEKADITAIFEVNAHVKQWLEENEYDSEELILRRVISASGKSRAFINGIPCTLEQQRVLGEQLVDIHGQHAHQSLLKPTAQRQLLDSHAQINGKALAQYWKAWQAAEQALYQATHQAEQQKQEEERLQWQLSELKAIAPKKHEWEEVNADYNRLYHAASLLEGASLTAQLLDGEENSVLSALNRCLHEIGALSRHDPELESIYNGLESAQIACTEALSDLNGYLDSVELDPARLEQVEQRMQLLFDASKKFKVDAEQLPEYLVSLEEKLDSLSQSLDLEALNAQIDTQKALYMAEAQKISQQRQKTAQKLEKEITQAMHTLAMEGGQFKIELVPCEPSSTGLEQVQFLVAGHAGTTPRALNKVVSGGELSRISLALSVMANKAGRVPTLIFDEVDSGIGGGVAEVVGRLLRQLGRDHQVLCVTHLAQVAACAHHQFEVKKHTDGGTTTSTLHALSPSERVQEIARMLGGMTISQTTLEHAREMLATFDESADNK